MVELRIWRIRGIQTVLLTLLIQGGQQAATLVIAAGVVRALEPGRYAMYLLATGFVSVIATVATSGASSALMSQIGTKVDNHTHVATVLLVAGRVTRRATWWTAVPGALALTLLLLRVNSGVTLALVLVVLALSQAAAQVSTGIATNVLLLQRRYSKVQLVGLLPTAVRLALLPVIFVAPATVACVVALGSSVIGQLLMQRGLEKLLSPIRLDAHLLDPVAMSSSRSDFLLKFRQIAPPNVFFVAQGQLLYWILAGLSATGQLALIGGLARYTAVFQIVVSVANILVVPRYARIGGDVRSLRNQYASSVALVVAIALALVGLCWLAADQLLEILGNEYRGNQVPFIIIMGGAAGTVVVGLMNNLNQARGWVSYQWVGIPLTAVTLLIGLLTLDLTDPTQAALFAAIGFVPGLLLDSVRAVIGIVSTGRSEVAA